MKRFALCFIAVLIFFSLGVVCLASSMSYVGNKSTKVYHMSECTHAGISTKNRIYFSSRSEAEAKGYRRCYYCGDGVVEPGHGGGVESGLGSNSDGYLSTGSSETDASKQVKSSEGDGELNVWTVIVYCFYAGLLGLFLWEFFGTYVRKPKQKQKFKAKTHVTQLVQSLPKQNPPVELKNEVSVSSSFIAAAAYDKTTLYLRFTDGKVYAYQNVPVEIYEGMVRTQSPGRYFHEHIDKIYPYYIPDRQ